MLKVDIDKIIPLTDARNDLNRIADEVNGSNTLYVLTKNGTPIAVVVGVNHLEKLTGLGGKDDLEEDVSSKGESTTEKTNEPEKPAFPTPFNKDDVDKTAGTTTDTMSSDSDKLPKEEYLKENAKPTDDAGQKQTPPVADDELFSEFDDDDLKLPPVPPISKSGEKKSIFDDDDKIGDTQSSTGALSKDSTPGDTPLAATPPPIAETDKPEINLPTPPTSDNSANLPPKTITPEPEVKDQPEEEKSDSMISPSSPPSTPEPVDKSTDIDDKSKTAPISYDDFIAQPTKDSDFSGPSAINDIDAKKDEQPPTGNFGGASTPTPSPTIDPIPGSVPKPPESAGQPIGGTDAPVTTDTNNQPTASNNQPSTPTPANSGSQDSAANSHPNYTFNTPDDSK
jgi:prevent-host-death family protein